MDSMERERREEEDECDRDCDRECDQNRLCMDNSGVTDDMNCREISEDDQNLHRRSGSSGRGGASEEKHQRDRLDAGAAGDECNGSQRRSSSDQRGSGRGRDGGVTGNTTTLYITNVPTNCSLREIRRLFEEVGDVQDCRIVSNPVTRESRGFAFLSFVDPNNAQVAIDRFDGKAYLSASVKPLRVERAKRNKPHNPTPGLYKGPPGASIKYDKTGRLKPGFLPYYAVAPGASREFMPSQGPVPMEYFGGGNGGRFGRHHPNRWPDERDHSMRGGYDMGGRFYDRMDMGGSSARGSMYDVRSGAAELGCDMRMERSYERGGYDARSSAYDTRGSYDRGAAMYDARSYDRGAFDNRMQYEDHRSDGRNAGYGDYYGGSSGYDYMQRAEAREMKPSARERSRSRGRRDRRRSVSPGSRHHRSTRR